MCKRQPAPLCKQQTAPLLKEQMTSDKAPFSFVGIDYFGPLIVKARRTHWKSYGCLFTCLTTNFNNFTIERTPCINNAFRIRSFSADYYFDIKTPKRKICVIFAFEYTIQIFKLVCLIIHKYSLILCFVQNKT